MVQCLLLVLLLVGCSQTDQHTYQGYIEGDDLYLASPNSGILKKLFVDRGDSVKKGQLMFQLDSDPQAIVVAQYEADLKQAQDILKDLQNPRRTPEINAVQAQIDQADAQLELAKLRVKRFQTLYSKGATDRDTLDNAIAFAKESEKHKAEYEANLRLALLGSREEQIKAQQAQIISVTAKLTEAKWQLTQKYVYAPDDGIILDTYYSNGELVASFQPVASLLTQENVHVQFFVPVTTLPLLQLKQSITFLCYGCHNKGTAVISYISPQAEYIPPLVYSRENQDKLVFRIKAILPRFQEYKPGQPVTVWI